MILMYHRNLEFTTKCIRPTIIKILNGMKKALRETQTLRAGCSKAEPNFFRYLYLQTQFGEDR